MNSSKLIFFLFAIFLLGACSAPAKQSAATKPPHDTPPATSTPILIHVPAPTATPTPEPLTVSIPAQLPEDYLTALQKKVAGGSSSSGLAIRLTDDQQEATTHIVLRPAREDNAPILAERVFVVVAPFATLQDKISLRELQQRWEGTGKPLFVTDEAGALLEGVMGSKPANPVDEDALMQQLQATPGALGVLPFDHLDPTYKVIKVDGANPVDNRFEIEGYPLAIQLVVQGPASQDAMTALADAISPVTNRDPAHLTTLLMTGVTAMARMTAYRMEQKGYDYPARVIGPELSAADITHISNEIPFIEGCKVNTSEHNLTFCSKPAYWVALEKVGTDIVGLSGNHVNDFGRKGARESLAFYEKIGIPVYGSGLNVEEACKPLILERNGNSFAFIAALAYRPAQAWATETQPGTCYFYDNRQKIMAMIRSLSQKVDIVAVELQFFETYKPYPTSGQVKTFRALRQAGADIVTGVQSHVPQALEPYGEHDAGGAGIIAYGLGNFFFDQMWSQPTRDELYLRHTIYNGKLIHTEILTGVLYDYAQPHWTTPEQRSSILKRIFNAAPRRQ